MRATSSDPKRSFPLKVAVIGYGAAGRDHAFGLRHAGHEVVVGLRLGGMSWVRARRDRFRAEAPSALVGSADVVVVLVPDDEQASVWAHAIQPYVSKDALVVFGRGTALATGAFEPRGVDVVLVTGPHDDDAICRVAVHTDATGSALERAVAYARATFGQDARVGTTTVAAEADAEVAAMVERAGGIAPLLASVERSMSRVRDSHAPEEAKIEFYERLHELVVHHADASSTRMTDRRSATSLSGQGPRRGLA